MTNAINSIASNMSLVPVNVPQTTTSATAEKTQKFHLNKMQIFETIAVGVGIIAVGGLLFKGRVSASDVLRQADDIKPESTVVKTQMSEIQKNSKKIYKEAQDALKEVKDLIKKAADNNYAAEKSGKIKRIFEFDDVDGKKVLAGMKEVAANGKVVRSATIENLEPISIEEFIKGTNKSKQITKIEKLTSIAIDKEFKDGVETIGEEFNFLGNKLVRYQQGVSNSPTASVAEKIMEVTDQGYVIQQGVSAIQDRYSALKVFNFDEDGVFSEFANNYIIDKTGKRYGEIFVFSDDSKLINYIQKCKINEKGALARVTLYFDPDGNVIKPLKK